MMASPLGEVRSYGEMMLAELRKVIPSFLTRVDREDRGVVSAAYLEDNRTALEMIAANLDGSPTASEWSVELTDWDPDAETDLAAAALYAVSELSDAEIQRQVRSMTDVAADRDHLSAGRRSPEPATSPDQGDGTTSTTASTSCATSRRSGISNGIAC